MRCKPAFIFHEFMSHPGINKQTNLRPPCEPRVPHSKGKWLRLPVGPLPSVVDLHTEAKYQCGSTVLSAEYNTGHFLCGHLSSSDLQRASELFSWQWEPDECDLPTRVGPDLDELLQDFLETAKGFKVAFVGDSFAHEQFISLRCLLGQRVVSGELPNSFKTTTDIEVSKYDSPFLVSRETLHLLDEPQPTKWMSQGRQSSSGYVKRNKVLEADLELSRREDTFDWDNYNYTNGEAFGHILKDNQLYLVLNTGAHWHNNMEGYSKMVINVLGHLLKFFKGKRVFYRASSHGHVGCMDVKSPQQPEDATKESFVFNWRLLKHYNAIWKYEISRLNDPRFVFLDVFPMSEQRADSHSLSKFGNDCFHYCLPGVVDYWNLLLLSFIVHGDWATDSTWMACGESLVGSCPTWGTQWHGCCASGTACMTAAFRWVQEDYGKWSPLSTLLLIKFPHWHTV